MPMGKPAKLPVLSNPSLCKNGAEGTIYTSAMPHGPSEKVVQLGRNRKRKCGFRERRIEAGCHRTENQPITVQAAVSKIGSP
jgi:hypothetical protein